MHTVQSRQALRRRWHDALGAWQIPPPILAAATESPWALPGELLAARARGQLEAPAGVSVEVAAQAMPIAWRGSVLDVGAGAGAASLALRDRAGQLTAVDEDATMLARFAEMAAGAGVAAATVHGRWPDVARATPVADVVVCHHVLYNVADLEPFVAELTTHARGRVVIEMTARHPMALMNPLWKKLHGLDRPDGPTASDAIALLTSLGLDPRWHTWQRSITSDGIGYPELIETTRKRLCLPPERADDVDHALRELGAGPELPYLGGGQRELVTIWWPGFAH